MPPGNSLTVSLSMFCVEERIREICPYEKTCTVVGMFLRESTKGQGCACELGYSLRSCLQEVLMKHHHEHTIEKSRKVRSVLNILFRTE